MSLVVVTKSYGKVYPIVRAAYVGDTVFILCDSLTPPIWTKEGKDVYSHYWTRQGTVLQKQSKLNQNNLLLKKVVEKDSGHYVCEGTLESGNETFKASSELLVGGEYFYYFRN